MKPIIATYLVFVLLQSVGPLAAQLHAQNTLMTTALDSLFQNRITKKEMAGAVCLISQNGKIIYDKSFGYSNLEEGLLMKKNSLFRLKSMNKAIISLVALKLVDQGKINLDDLASNYFPELKNKKVGVVKEGKLIFLPADKPITLRHIISHSSGFGSSWNAGELESIYNKFEDLETNNYKNYKDAVKAYLQLPLIDHPGNGWYYGLGHLIMANLIEGVTGVPIQEFLEKEIFRPLAMNSTTFSLPKIKQKDLAQYYTHTSDGKLKKTLQDSIYTWDTDLFSTAEDYHNFCQVLLNNGYLKGKQFIKPEIMKELSKPTIGLKGDAIDFQKGYAFGLGVSVRVNDEKAEYKGSMGDYGWFGIFNTAFWIDPKKQIIGVVLSQSPWNEYLLAKRVKNIVYSQN